MSLNIALDFQIAADRFRDEIAILYNGREISYKELAESVHYWTIFLAKLGVSRGDNICLVMPNVPEFTIAYFAILHLGASVIPCNPLLTSRELARLFTHAEARFVLTCTSCVASCVEAVVREVDSCAGVIVSGHKEDGLKVLPKSCHVDSIYWLEDEIFRLKECFAFSMQPITVTVPGGNSTPDEAAYSSSLECSSSSTISPSDVALCPTISSGVSTISSDFSTTCTGAKAQQCTTGVWLNNSENPFAQNFPWVDTQLVDSSRKTPQFCVVWESVPSANGQLYTPCSPAPVPTNPDDSAVILYTSGTTGFPKGAQLTHFNLYSNAQFVRESMTGYKPGKRTLAILPFYHSFGQTVVQNAALFSGATVVMVPRFDPKRVLQTISEQKVDVVAGVPTMLIHLLKTQQKLGLDVSSVKQFISGGSTLSVASYNELREVFPDCEILEGYGLSETSPLATAVTPGMVSHPGSIGQEISGVQVRIMRPDHSFANPGEVGEIVIRGHNVMKGYYKNQLATENAFVHSWFLSGDLGYCDEDGFFYLVDRRKDIIIRAGMNIYPREIEEVLNAHPAVQLVSVLGVPHPIHGEDVIGFVTLNPGFEKIDSLILSKYCRTRLAAYKCPQKIIILDSLPKGPTGKILKRELKEYFLKNSENSEN